MGYRENEFAAMGVPMDERVDRFEESVQIVRSLWSGEPISFHGKHFRIDEQRISLPPVQPGGPPIWVGAGPHRTGAQRAARLGDAWIIPPHVTPERLDVLLGHYRAERERVGRAAGELVVRRELVLDPDAERARSVGTAARTALTRQYAAFNAPDRTEGYRHLQSDAAAAEVADRSYLFTDPAQAVSELRGLEAQGFTYVILRMQWFDLPHERMLETLELFRDHVRPAFSKDAT
jgi:alkanesulfonate monooxygenase SsuD/methylene tetrahydromethanopterin reductase-like flavin-dependent oxidoreductase (luciferase family)